MPHIAFDRSDGTELLFGLLTECNSKAFNFYRVSKRCRCPLCFDIANCRWFNSGILNRHRDGPCLALGTRCGETPFTSSIIIYTYSLDDCEYFIAFLFGGFPAFE